MSSGSELRGVAPLRIGLLSPCGWGNLGDAAIQQTIIHELKSRYESVLITGITLVPADTIRRHGIDAVPIGAVSLPQYGIDSAGYRNDGGGPTKRLENEHGSVGESAGWAWRVLKSSVRYVARALLPDRLPWAIRQDWLHWWMAKSTVARLDWLVISGGGQIDDFWGGPWGHPWALFKWTMLARIAGCRVLMVSVGTGTLDSALSRFLIRRVLGTVQYRSFRDEGSRELVRNVGFFRSDPVYPDLAYGLPVSRALEAGRGARDRKMRIAISPMAYARPSTWPVKDAARYAQYVRKLADLAVALLKGGYELHLIYSDSPDKRVVSDLYAIIDAQFGGNQKLNIEIPSTDDVELFLAECRSADLVIASRLHSVVLAHVAGTPVLALSYDRKVRAAMLAANQMSNCLDIDAFNVEEALVKVESILSTREQHREAIEAHVQACRGELTAQYDQIFPRNMSVCLS